MRWRPPSAGGLFRWLLCCFGLLYVLAGNGLLPFAGQDARLGNFFSAAGGVGLEGLPDKGLRPARGAGASGEKVYRYAPNTLGWIDPWGLSCETTHSVRPSNSSLVGRIRGMLGLYPKVVDPRTGRNIPFLSGIGGKIPVAERVSWGTTERGAFIKEWYDRGYAPPRGGWAEYDIHHIQPREFGGSNDFWNLVPVQRQTHQDLFNAFWREFGGL